MGSNTRMGSVALAMALAVALLALGAGSPATAAGRTPDRPSAGAPSRLLDRPARGTDAIRRLGNQLDEAATRNRLTVERFRRLVTDDDAVWVDPSGMLLYIDEELPAAGGPTAEAADLPYSETFRLHSKPGAARVLHLDFDGHVVTGTAWNASYAVSTARQPAFDLDGDPTTFSATEQDVIQDVWHRVSEDFAPFDVDVTTEEPTLEAIERSSYTDDAYGTRVLITPSTQAHAAVCNSGCGGVAFVGVFSYTGSYYQPAWVFPQALQNKAKNIAEAASHEAGHNLGLSHDGVTGGASYYSGHNAWAPIMGVGYYRPVSQWSSGEYPSANQPQDDVEVMQQNGLPVRPDDHGDTPATATALGTGQTMTAAGVIATRGDKDYFRVDRGCAGELSIAAKPAATSPNLDIGLRLLDAAGAVLAGDDPVSVYSTLDLALGLTGSVRHTVPAGTYYVEVDGVGAATTSTGGYSDYGSLGAFTLDVTGCVPPPPGDRYVIADGGRITYYTPSSTAPLEVTGSESLTGSYSIREDPSSPSFGSRQFTVTDMRLVTPSGKVFQTVAGATANKLVCWESYGHCEPMVKLVATDGGVAAPGVQFVSTGIAPFGATWTGTLPPQSFTWNDPRNTYTGGGYGLYTEGKGALQIVASITMEAVNTTLGGDDGTEDDGSAEPDDGTDGGANNPPQQPADADGDGVDDVISDGASGTFRTPAAYGSIVDAGGMTVNVSAPAPPAEGVRIRVSGPTTSTATFSVCGFTLQLPGDSDSLVSCGSVRVEMLSGGPGTVVLGDGIATVSVPEGVTAKVHDAIDGAHQVDHLGGVATSDPISVTLDGVTRTLDEGTLTLATTEFVGFGGKVASPPTLNNVPAGRVVPLQWRLLDASGEPVTDLQDAWVTVQQRSCSGGGATPDQPGERTAGLSGLINLGDGYYRLNWTTPRSYAGSCKTMMLDLGEGVTRDAWFRFTTK